MPEIDFTERLDIETDIYLNKLLSDIMQAAASDLFLTCRKNHVDIAVRRMGSITSWGTLTREDGMRLITHIKATADMDVSRSPAPQDGRVNVALKEGSYIDLRLSTLPTLFGEDLAIRILDPKRMLLGVEDIGFHQVNLNRLISMINRPGGLVLVTGPTGMGKTTTLYACLNFLNDGTRKIHTLEDPIEFTLDGIHQSQVNLRRGVDFPDLLRGVLRQSPDVIMVGEIRDAATADIVVRAANSGQLVFATCHSGTTAGACEAMLVFGVKPQFLASSLLGIVTQRLVRKLCPDCKIPLNDHTEEDDTASGICVPKGCPKCNNTGYAGRIAVGEVLRATPEIKRLIRQSAPISEIHRIAVEQGMVDLQTDAQRKLDEGLTSPDEIIRAIPAGFDS
ncbi:MAG: GspE/PulE family protein [Planctomycetaceae bacterium]|nr:GspE/PulE family protein [Planctomycetaceae bacterium]